MLLTDCDGVLTDGRLYFSNVGEAMKVFNVRDGQGIVSWHKAGFDFGIISGRGAEEIIQARAEELGITFVRTRSQDKVADACEFAADIGVQLDEFAFIGDDIGDLAVMKAVGFSAAVADAADEVKTAAAYITKRNGGDGAVREVIDMILAAKREAE